VGQDEVRAFYEAAWKEPYPFLVPATRPPLDVKALQDAWSRAARGVVEAAKAAWTDVAGAIYHPHLTAFQAAILNSWPELGQERVVAHILLIIQEMHDDPLVAVVAYEQLQASLQLAGEAFLPKKVADLQKQYMDAHPKWREVQQRLSHESLRTRVEDNIPGGLPETPEVFDEPEEQPDPFSD